MQYLGNTLEEIAFEKSGIIKENSNVVVYPQEENIINVIKKQAIIKNSEVYEVNKNNAVKIKSDLSGQNFKYLKKVFYRIT